MCRNLIQRVTTDHRFLSVRNMIISSLRSSLICIYHVVKYEKIKIFVSYIKFRKKLWHFRNEHRKVGVPEDTLFRTGRHPFPYRKAISGKKGWHAAGLGHALICRCTGRIAATCRKIRSPEAVLSPPPPFQNTRTGCKGQDPTRVMCSSHLVYYQKKISLQMLKMF